MTDACVRCGHPLEWVKPYVNPYEDDPETGRPFLTCVTNGCPAEGDVVRMWRRETDGIPEEEEIA